LISFSSQLALSTLSTQWLHDNIDLSQSVPLYDRHKSKTSLVYSKRPSSVGVDRNTVSDGHQADVDRIVLPQMVATA
jgi:hypothetical protein